MSAEAATTLSGLGPYLSILVAATLPTQVWRVLGVLFAGRLDEGSQIFAWVKAVATALVAAVIARLILFPTGALGEVPWVARVAAAGAGFAVFAALGRRLALGILAAELVLAAAWLTLR
jgi:branched-subunit amino acid transport protein